MCVIQMFIIISCNVYDTDVYYDVMCVIQMFIIISCNVYDADVYYDVMCDDTDVDFNIM